MSTSVPPKVRIMRLAGCLAIVLALIGALMLSDGVARADGHDGHDGSTDGGTDVPAPPRGIEDYARYQPQTLCSPRAKVGTVALQRWTVRNFGGRLGPISRSCGPGTSEHKEGRAFDWMLDARRPADRLRVRRFLEKLFAADAAGNRHARARRMGVMYVIWADRMWSAGDGFRAKPYLSSSCRTVKRCSRTLRHLDHVHVSITRPASRGLTSWYAGRV